MVTSSEEWLSLDEDNRLYHLKQLRKVYRMTEIFFDFLDYSIRQSKYIIDLGCGAGANTLFGAEKFSQIQFKGIDINTEMIQLARKTAQEQKIKNVHFEVGDIYCLEKHEKIEGVILHQTISWLPHFEEPLLEILRKINPRWIAMSGLFYEGDISAKTQVIEHKKKKQHFYNTYSLSELERFFIEKGGSAFAFQRFDIDIDLEKPVCKDVMGTYTVPVKSSASISRLQISGPLLMNWGFVLVNFDSKAERIRTK